jgi:predicted nucleic acid-binding protein
MEKILIDTDVILDFFFNRQPFSDDASSLLALCETNQIKGFITPVICSNVYYLLCRTASHAKVVDHLKQLLLILDVLAMDEGVVRSALHSSFKDFEDALQNFSAMKFGDIDVIVTRNVKDYQKSEIGVMTPSEFIKSIQL